MWTQQQACQKLAQDAILSLVLNKLTSACRDETQLVGLSQTQPTVRWRSLNFQDTKWASESRGLGENILPLVISMCALYKGNVNIKGSPKG